MRNRTRRRQRTTQRGFKPTAEHLEERCLLSGDPFRSITGEGNNETNTNWGSANAELLRTAPAAYADGIDDPVVGSPARPSPRAVSNAVVAQTTEERVFSDREMSAMIYGWGQFLDHDFDLTGSNSAEPFNISVPAGDPFFDPNNTGSQVIFFNRSKSVLGTGTSTSNPRQQPNEITAFIDASMVYGSSEAVASALRTHVGGLLKTSPGADGMPGTQDDLLPYNSMAYFNIDQLAALNMANGGPTPSDQLFAAGDVRANENIELTSLHTLFVREHNRLAGLIAAANPSASDDFIYDRARAIVGAEIEAISYNEWLPALLGPSPIPAYAGYNTIVNPGIATEFSTASFRVGHSMLGEDIEFINNDGSTFRDEIALNVGFFNPGQITQTVVPGGEQTDIGRILKYLVSDPSSEIDTSITDPVRNFLFGQPGQGGFDLSSLNIQRGRDHGLADYNTIRHNYGLPRVTNFNQITSDNSIRLKLKQLYGNVNNIDPWVGGLAEDHIPGTSTGPLIRAVLIDQFSRVRDGDRFWYQNQSIYLPPGEPDLGSTTLAAVIARNTAITNLQSNVFFFKFAISGTVFNDLNGNGVKDAGELYLTGRVIQLEDAETGDVLATELTDGTGHYNFNVFDGITVGRFNVRVVPPNNWSVTTPNPVSVAITKGDDFVTVDFGNVMHIRPLLAADVGASGRTGAEPLTPEMLQPIVAEAVARWQATGIAADVLTELSGVQVQIADLPGNYLGWSSPDGITIDSNAAGYGWFIDPTPGDDVEFPATTGSLAYGHMDLLTVLAHEMGHQLGLEHSEDGDDVMAETLAAGVRLTPALDDAGLGLSNLSAVSSQASLDDLVLQMAMTLAGTSTTPDIFTYGTQDQSILFAVKPLTAAGDDAAPTLVADDDRRLTQTSAVLDKGVADGATDLLKEDVLGDPVPGLRPPQ